MADLLVGHRKRAANAVRWNGTRAVGQPGPAGGSPVSCADPLAFSLVEMLVVLTLIGALAGIALPAVVDAIDDARVAHAEGEIAALGAEVSVFFYENDRYPNSLAEIGRAGALDPYGNPYYYASVAVVGKGGARRDRFLIPVNSDFDLYSAGKDGMTALPFTAPESQDDIIRGNNGMFIGLAEDY